MIRLVWPDIKKARKFGHSLKFIHARLVESGIPISYNQLTVYVSRIDREESATASVEKGDLQTETRGPRPEGVERQTRPPVESSSATRDPLENYRGTCIQKRSGFQGGSPDETKLI